MPRPHRPAGGKPVMKDRSGPKSYSPVAARASAISASAESGVRPATALFINALRAVLAAQLASPSHYSTLHIYWMKQRSSGHWDLPLESRF
ncbi:hypothetical protein GGR44_001634 [Sphingobium fontiphilum]|uniref:Uncharacterized protein n=1 Tax=Sphingobium fontiphilum TaxID=944425 RepID=A0A7W6DJT3_9SPHN|nr:hypothetical protein [Sphingobium fontiphilum]